MKSHSVGESCDSTKCIKETHLKPFIQIVITRQLMFVLDLVAWSLELRERELIPLFLALSFIPLASGRVCVYIISALVKFHIREKWK